MLNSEVINISVWCVDFTNRPKWWTRWNLLKVVFVICSAFNNRFTLYFSTSFEMQICFYGISYFFTSNNQQLMWILITRHFPWMLRNIQIFNIFEYLGSLILQEYTTGITGTGFTWPDRWIKKTVSFQLSTVV